MRPLLPRLLAAAGALLLLYLAGQSLGEVAREASDKLVSFLLRFGSRFEKELTPEGKIEQQMWRDQRLRDLRQRRMRGLYR